MAVALGAAATGLTACGLGAGAGEPQHVDVVVTKDFGRTPVGNGEQLVEGPSSDTAMRLLQRADKITTRYGGGFVQSIAGQSGGTKDGHPTDWFFYVNGIQASKSANAIKPSRGDTVWWDLHDWTATQNIPAVVGSFPEPFLHGENGSRYPLQLQCANDQKTACDTASAALQKAGVGLVSRAQLATAGGEDSLIVVVGLWSEIRADFVLRGLEKGPGTSGVYAKPSPDGKSIALLNPEGKVVRQAAPGTGIVAATRGTAKGAVPIWIVTADDEAGLQQAAAGLSTDALNGKFAVAIHDDIPTSLPIVG